MRQPAQPTPRGLTWQVETDRPWDIPQIAWGPSSLGSTCRDPRGCDLSSTAWQLPWRWGCPGQWGAGLSADILSSCPHRRASTPAVPPSHCFATWKGPNPLYVTELTTPVQGFIFTYAKFGHLKGAWRNYRGRHPQNVCMQLSSVCVFSHMGSSTRECRTQPQPFS